MSQITKSGPVNRRTFLQATAAASAMFGVHSYSAAEARKIGPNEKIKLAVMGVNGRGTDLSRTFTANTGCEIATVCDVDSRAIQKALKAIAEKQELTPASVGDFRKILDDPSIDALVIAAPDHWHGPATILGCTAGKHVYVEKPASHNPREGELMIEAARKHDRVVQLGTQRRSFPGIQEAIGKLRDGAIGRVMFARGWYNNKRPSIGRGKPAEVPAWLDYALWQGPAPEQAFRDNLIHYNWHWFWNWGTGELGNNGVHAIDVCRWGLDVGYPTRVTSGGGKYRWDDDQETPDTHVVTFDFDGKSLVWEGRSWSPRGFEGESFAMSFYGDEGSLVVVGNGYKIYDMKNKEVSPDVGTGGDGFHIANFLDSIRSGKRPSADIEEGHKTTLLCHLGNIAHRVGRVLNIDPKTGHIRDDQAAQKLWSREYRPGWEPKV